jgi:NADP-dependent 3-hydroxy acid dehydrogenase YdfG
MENYLTNRVALVTGASSGIGKATALLLASKGVKVVLVARRKDRLESIATYINHNGGDSVAVVADVTCRKDVARAVETSIEKYGSLDILINNAGVMLLGSVANGVVDDWEKMFNVNVLGLMYFTHAALPYLKKQPSSHIINISSVAGRTARAGVAVYNATKWAVVGFSEALRQEVLKDRIKVTVVEPGAVDTELFSHNAEPSIRQAIEERFGKMKKLTAEDIANSIIYALEQPDYVNVNEILIRPLEQET